MRKARDLDVGWAEL